VGKKRRKKIACCSLHTMPCPFKKAAHAFAQCHAGQGVFSSPPKNISESDNGETEQDPSDEEDTNTQSVIVMQALVADYLPAEMKTR